MTAKDMAGAQSRPAALTWAVRLLVAEAVGVGAVAVYLAYEDLTGSATDLKAALAITGFAVLAAAALGWLAYALHHRRSGARAPAIVLQLLLIPIGLSMIQGGLPWLGIPLIGLGLLVTFLIVSRSSTRAFGLE